jgi:hypothetical protein
MAAMCAVAAQPYPMMATLIFLLMEKERSCGLPEMFPIAREFAAGLPQRTHFEPISP